MEKFYKPEKFRSSEKVNLKEFFESFSQFKGESLSGVDDDGVFRKLGINNELEQHRLITDCSIDLLDSVVEDLPENAQHLDTVQVREKYKTLQKDLYSRHCYHKERYEHSVPVNLVTDLQPGDEFAVSFRIYQPFRFMYSSTTAPRKIRSNSYLNLKFSHEIVALGRNTLAEVRDTIRCAADLGLCVEVDETYQEKSKIDPKTLYPSGFFYIDDTFYNDMRSTDSIDYSEVIRKWGHEQSIPMGVALMETTQIKELTPRFGYPYVYQHQGNCEHIFVFSDAWILSRSDNLNSTLYPMCTGIHQAYNKLCHICGNASARWICLDSDRLPQNGMLFCNMCFKSYNYVDGVKVGNFKAYPFFNTSAV